MWTIGTRRQYASLNHNLVNVECNVERWRKRLHAHSARPWIGAGTMGAMGARTREDRRCLFARSFVRLFVRWTASLDSLAGTLASSDHVRVVPYTERDYKSLANEWIPFVIAIVAAPVRCRFVASRLNYRDSSPPLVSPLVWKLGLLKDFLKSVLSNASIRLSYRLVRLCTVSKSNHLVFRFSSIMTFVLRVRLVTRSCIAGLIFFFFLLHIYMYVHVRKCIQTVRGKWKK